MAAYEIIVDRAAERHVRSMPRELVGRIWKACQALAEDPFPGGKKVKGLANVMPPTHRLRVGDYRVIYRVHEPSRRVFVLGVVHRRDLERGVRNLPPGSASDRQ